MFGKLATLLGKTALTSADDVARNLFANNADDIIRKTVMNNSDDVLRKILSGNTDDIGIKLRNMVGENGNDFAVDILKNQNIPDNVKTEMLGELPVLHRASYFEKQPSKLRSVAVSPMKDVAENNLYGNYKKIVKADILDTPQFATKSGMQTSSFGSSRPEIMSYLKNKGYASDMTRSQLRSEVYNMMSRGQTAQSKPFIYEIVPKLGERDYALKLGSNPTANEVYKHFIDNPELLKKVLPSATVTLGGGALLGSTLNNRSGE